MRWPPSTFTLCPESSPHTLRAKEALWTETPSPQRHRDIRITVSEGKNMTLSLTHMSLSVWTNLFPVRNSTYERNKGPVPYPPETCIAAGEMTPLDEVRFHITTQDLSRTPPSTLRADTPASEFRKRSHESQGRVFFLDTILPCFHYCFCLWHLSFRRRSSGRAWGRSSWFRKDSFN